MATTLPADVGDPIVLEGRLDTLTAPLLDERLKTLDPAGTITLDCAALEYVSSAGLRVLLAAHKRAKAAGGLLRIVNVGEIVAEILDMTGFSEILTLSAAH
jgi:anti-sigma B factor antagonist